MEASEEKRQPLLAMGIDTVSNPSLVDLGEALASLTGGFGPDVVIEAVGHPETFRAAVDLVCFTGRVVYVGYAKSEVSYNTSLFNVKELGHHGIAQRDTRRFRSRHRVFIRKRSAVRQADFQGLQVHRCRTGF